MSKIQKSHEAYILAFYYLLISACSQLHFHFQAVNELHEFSREHSQHSRVDEASHAPVVFAEMDAYAVQRA